MHAFSEIPLLIFTLLSQMAVGIIIMGQLAIAGQPEGFARKRIAGQSLPALIFVGTAALISCIHLGTPLHAPFTIFHVGSSWLSREILFALLTVAAIGGIVYLRWKQPDSRWLKPLALAASIIGLIFIYTMSKVYSSPFMPGWEHNSTFFLFLASAIVLGSLWQGCVLGFGDGDNRAAPLWRLFFFAIAGLILIAAFMPLAMPEPVTGINPLSRDYPPETIANLQSLHACLCGAGILLFMCGIRQCAKKNSFAAIMALAFLFAASGEIAGRMAFYMSYARLGM